MNLKKVQKELSKVFKDWLDIDFSVEDGCLRGDLDFTIKGCDDDVHGTLLFSEKTNVAYFDFDFDDIEKNEQTLDLVNTYNEDINLFNAVIEPNPESGYCLTLSYGCLIPDESLVGEYTHFVMDELLDDEALKDLIAITELTH